MNEGIGKDSFESFVAINKQDGFFAADYLHLIAKLKELPADFIIKTMELVWPEFIEQDGLVFVEPLFDEQNYHQMRKNADLTEGIEYWLNQFLVSDVFASLSYEEALHVAELIAQCWNAKLLAELSDTLRRAKVCYDAEHGDVLVTVSSH